MCLGGVDGDLRWAGSTPVLSGTLRYGGKPFSTKEVFMKRSWIPRLYNCPDIILIEWNGYEFWIKKFWRADFWGR